MEVDSIVSSFCAEWDLNKNGSETSEQKDKDADPQQATLCNEPVRLISNHVNEKPKLKEELLDVFNLHHELRASVQISWDDKYRLLRPFTSEHAVNLQTDGVIFDGSVPVVVHNPFAKNNFQKEIKKRWVRKLQKQQAGQLEPEEVSLNKKEKENGTLQEKKIAEQAPPSQNARDHKGTRSSLIEMLDPKNGDFSVCLDPAGIEKRILNSPLAILVDFESCAKNTKLVVAGEALVNLIMNKEIVNIDLFFVNNGIDQRDDSEFMQEKDDLMRLANYLFERLDENPEQMEIWSDKDTTVFVLYDPIVQLNQFTRLVLHVHHGIFKSMSALLHSFRIGACGIGCELGKLFGCMNMIRPENIYCTELAHCAFGTRILIFDLRNAQASSTYCEALQAFYEKGFHVAFLPQVSEHLRATFLLDSDFFESFNFNIQSMDRETGLIVLRGKYLFKKGITLPKYDFWMHSCMVVRELVYSVPPPIFSDFGRVSSLTMAVDNFILARQNKKNKKDRKDSVPVTFNEGRWFESIEEFESLPVFYKGLNDLLAKYCRPSSINYEKMQNLLGKRAARRLLMNLIDRQHAGKEQKDDDDEKYEEQTTEEQQKEKEKGKGKGKERNTTIDFDLLAQRLVAAVSGNLSSKLQLYPHTTLQHW